MVTFSLVFILFGACLLCISSVSFILTLQTCPYPSSLRTMEFVSLSLPTCSVLQHRRPFTGELKEFVLKTPIDLNSTGPPKTFTLLPRYGETRPDGPRRLERRAVSSNTNQKYHLKTQHVCNIHILLVSWGDQKIIFPREIITTNLLQFCENQKV